MGNERIKVRTSVPGLQNKVQAKIEGPADIIYWYIRFNIQLDEATVSERTMNVTDTDGYIMRTDISFNRQNNTIAVSPLDSYEENRYYLLNISKKVRSAKGKNLKSTIHILFKLLEDKVSEFKVMKKDAKIPKPQPRPKDYDARQKSRKPSRFDMEYIDKTSLDRMSTVGFSFNPILGLAGILMAIFGLATANITAGIIGAALCLAGMVHIVVQMNSDFLRSKLLFNKGVRLFNRERYREAERFFKKALIADPDNELAQYGMYKSELFRKGGK